MTKLSKLNTYRASGDNRSAILMAAKFGDLGPQRDAILKAREAYLRPEFQLQLKRDPAALIAAGVAAMCKRWGNV